MLEFWKLALRSLKRKGLRTFLTVSGIAIGVASVVIIGTIGRAGTQAVNAELDSLGISGISVSSNAGSNVDLLKEDLETIRKLPNVDNAMPLTTENSLAACKGQTISALIWGIDAGAKQVIAIEVKYGRTISAADVNSNANVCMVDENVAKNLFKRDNVVGKTISLLVGGVFDEYKIIGITKQGSGILQSLMGDYIPSFVYIPYTTKQNIDGSGRISQIAVKLDNSNQVDAVSKNIVDAIDRNKGVVNSVKTDNLVKQRDRLGNLLNIVSIILSAIGAISLLVAGLGIMTVMLVSVNERTREIGIKKAIGARSGIILMEFLMEALTISVFGSIIGICIGTGVALLATLLFGIPLSISVFQLIYSVLVAVCTGIVFGVYPAIKASRLKPVEALRRE
ncbi:MAG: ABC transporter substrate-binding protein [Clostridiales bacterium 43-6]|nr:MAG: ABC transporter substrate-binding protein [Clostridiales bacterium 43-6]